MRKFLCILLCIGVIELFPLEVFAYSDEEICFFVSQDGDDSGTGDILSPFRTLEAARNAVRNLKSNGKFTKPVNIFIREGEYQLEQSFVLSEIDSGTEMCPVTYSAYDGENVTISGAMDLQSSDFSYVTDVTELSKLNADAKSNIMCADLKALGILEYGKVARTDEVSGIEIFLNEEAQTVSRWPNDGYANVGTVKSNNPLTFKSNIERALQWNEEDAYVVGMWGFDWHVETKKINSVSLDGIITTNSSSVEAPKSGQRYYAHNILKELDSPGEYYIDRENGKLYYFPKANDFDNLKISVLSDSIIKGTTLSYVNFKDLKLMYSQKDGIEIDGYIGGNIENCKVKNTGRNGITVTTGDSSVISRCTVTDTGMHGIKLSGGNVTTLEFGNNVITDCDIFKCSRLRDVMISAVSISGVGNRIEYSKIHDVPQQAIVFKGNEHKIVHNEIYNACYNSSDCGAVNNGLSWVERGTQIMYNYFHDIYDVNGTYGNAIYLDDMLSGIKIRGNIFYHCGNAIFIHGGRDNIVQENTIYDCLNSIRVSTLSHINNPTYTDKTNGLFYRSLLSVPFNKKPYTTYYPELIALATDSEPFYPKNNNITNNSIVNSARIVASNEAQKYSQINNNSYSQCILYIKK